MADNRPSGRLSLSNLLAILAIIIALTSLYYELRDFYQDWLFRTSLEVVLWLHPSDGSHQRVVTQTDVFPTGSLVRVDLRAGAPGFIYVMTRSCDGQAELIYPNSSESPWINAGERREVPSEGMRFEGARGVDTLVVVFSQRPLPLFDELIRRNHPPAGLIFEHPFDPTLQSILAGSYRDQSVVVRRLELQHVDPDHLVLIDRQRPSSPRQSRGARSVPQQAQEVKHDRVG